MIDHRLCDQEDGDPIERELLLSMRSDMPPADARRRTLATLGLVGAGTAMAPTAVIAKKGLAALLASKGIHALITKTALVVAAVATVALAVRVAVHAPARKATTPVARPTASASAPVAAMSATPDPATAASTPPSAEPTTSAGTPSEKVKSPSSSVAEAIALLDAARKALDAGDVTRAFAQLDRYEARFPKGPLRPEADLLRIEALVRRGDRSAAEALADALAIQLPGSAHAQRARDLLESNPP